MVNINDIDPSQVSTAPPTSPHGGVNIFNVPPDQIQSESDYNDEKYGTVGQQALTVAEGAGKGLVGPLATAAEAGLTKLGVKGLTPQDQAARESTNPVEHTLSEAGGFGAGLVADAGIAPLVTGAGELAAKATGLGLDGAGAVSKIAASGVKTGAEMAALQTSDEVSKAINQDPGQTLGTAATQIGLSGIIGGAGGAVLGSVAPLWKTTANKLGVEKLASDFMGETQFLHDNPDMVQGATNELSSRMAEADNMRTAMSETKPEVLMKAMPEVTEKSTAKIDTQIQEISDKLTSKIEKAAESVKTKSAVPYIAEDLNAWQDAVSNPNASFADKFSATNKLKQNLEGYAKWGLTEEGSAKAALGRDLSNFIRPALEDTKVWGAAGDVQRITNKATSAVIDANKDLLGKVTSKLMGDREIDPNKLQTFFNQAEKGKAGLKANVIRNYLDHTQDLADAINKVHLDNGLEMPLASKLNPTPVLDHSLNTPMSAGRSLAQTLHHKGASMLSNAVGDTIGGGLGSVAGLLVGHPLAGAWAGEKVLSPTISALAKPFAEKAVDSEGMKATFDYVANAVKGTKTLNDATKNVFKAGAEVIPKNLIPDESSRKKLQKSLDHITQSPDNAMQVGGKVAHYLPDHASAAASTASIAQNYLNSLKPRQPLASPLDTEPPIDKMAEAKYNRALDVAQQPLMVLHYAKEGILLPQDVQTLNTIYPQLHSKIISSLTQELIQAKTDGVTIPYDRKQSMSLLLGTPVDSTMTPAAAQAVIASVKTGPSQTQQAPQSDQKSHKTSQATLSQMNKVNQLAATPQQARELDKKS